MGHLPLPDQQPFAARLSGAGSLRRELEALLAAAPANANPATYRKLVLEANACGKGSSAMRMWAWQRLRVRYLLDPSLAEFRAFLAGMRDTRSPVDRGLLCFLMFARTDRLFRELSLRTVSPHLSAPGTVVRPEAVDRAVATIQRQRGLHWSKETVAGVRRHLLSALKDFGILEGAAEKRTSRLRPGPATAVFAVRLGRLEGLADRRLMASRWFRLLGLDEPGVVDLLYTATRERALTFRMQGGVVELSLPMLATA
jgi:hypothetical protein